MERINKHNYEVFFLDYIEGKLDDSYLDEFKKFLSQNPSLKEELKDFENIKLEPQKIIFNNKEELIKETQSKHFEISNLEYLCIGDLENDLDEKERQELKIKLEHKSAYRNEHKLFKSTKLTPDLTIKYPNKKRLERKQIPVYLKAFSYVAAASVAILLFLNQAVFKTENIANSNIGSAIALSSQIVKPIYVNEINDEISPKQESLNSHNQTIRQTNNNDLAFNDNEPHDKENLYKELTVSIPDLRSEALIYETKNFELANYKLNTEVQRSKKADKEDFWQYAETGVNVWKLISSSEMEMKNKYNENGSIEKLNLVASNFKFSKTFNKK